MAVTEIKSGDIVLARVIPAGSWNQGLGFYSDDKDFIQVGTWKYDSGKELLAHIHNEVERSITHTQEVIYIRKGKIRAKIFNPDRTFNQEIIAGEGDTLIMLHGGHSYSIIEDDTQVIEVKNGPYLGPEIDRERF